MSGSMSLGFYRLATGLLEPLAPGLLRRRADRGKEDRARLTERLGRASQPRPAGPLVWLHGASVGETMSLLPFVERLRRERPELTVLVTSGTRTSAMLLARRLPPGAIHQYLPVDGPHAVAAFLDHWRPDAGIVAESELWPNLILAARARGVRLALISARITEASASGWAKAPAAARKLLSAFELILPQDAESAARIEALGGRLGPALNLKYAGQPLPHDPEELARLRAAIGDRKVVLAASTHPGEEAFIRDAVESVASMAACGLLVVAPRHPERGEAVCGEFEGYASARRGAGEAPSDETQVYVADTLGEMGLLFQLADVVIMGGAFLPGVGGHNPLEPARLGRGVITGPDPYNFREVYARMDERGAVLRAATVEELAGKTHLLLRDEARRLALGAAAQAFAAEQAAAAEDAMRVLETLLPAR